MVRSTTATDDATDESNDDLSAIAEWAIEMSKRAGDGETKNPVEMAFAEASNGDDYVTVRFTGGRTDGRVDFDISEATLYEDAYKPDHIIAEHFGHEAAIEDALDALRSHADLRTVGNNRCGAIKFDRDTGDVVGISIYGVTVDDHDAAVDDMRACFEDDD